MLGYSESELLEKTSRETTYADDVEMEERSLESLLLGERDSYEIEKRYLHRDGSPVWAAMTTSAVRDNTGSVVYRISAVQNINERKLAGAALKKSEEKFSKAFRRSPMALVLATASEDLSLTSTRRSNGSLAIVVKA